MHLMKTRKRVNIYLCFSNQSCLIRGIYPMRDELCQTLSAMMLISQPTILVTPFWKVHSIKTRIAHTRNEFAHFIYSASVKS